LKTFLFTVFDNKTQVYCAPFVAQTYAAALRDFAYAANDKTCPIGRYPTDYTLYSIGEYDDEDGSITVLQPKNLGTASTLVNTIEETADV
jgi:hypothetical protein